MADRSTISHFLADDRGAISVDWTVISSAAVGLAIATTAVMTDTFDILAGQMDGELRSRSMSEDWVQFAANHFEDVLQTGYITEEEAALAYEAAAPLLNNQLVTTLAEGITAMEEGTITPEELVALIGVASVAYQRNIVDDATLDYYFGFDGSDPYYMTIAGAPTATY